MSKIEWTEKTWNPIVGCSVVSKGCTNCYAMALANRLLDGNPKSPHYDGTTKKVNGNPIWTGKVALASEKALLEPLNRKKPTMYFVNSMGDLFHEDVPGDWIDRVFAVMALCPQHTFQVLTKRAERMREYFISDPISMIYEAIFDVSDNIARHAARSGKKHPWKARPKVTPFVENAIENWPLPNVWLGVSAEYQETANERIPFLLDTPAGVRFVSCEPLLGAIDLFNLAHPTSCDPDAHINAISGYEIDPYMVQTNRLNWVIFGGESGPNARPMGPNWVRSIRDQCVDADVPFFFKQWGAYNLEGEKVGKAKSGRELDGQVWNQMPSQEGL